MASTRANGRPWEDTAPASPQLRACLCSSYKVKGREATVVRELWARGTGEGGPVPAA